MRATTQIITSTTGTTDSKTTPKPPSPFPLTRLPGELRNTIYREYFNSVNTWDKGRTNDRLHAVQPCLNILHTSRQVRSEAASIFYEEYVGNPGGQPNSLTVPPATRYHWEITGNSKKAQIRRMAIFCQSLAENKTLDVNVALRFDVSSLSEPLSPRFAETLTRFMVLKLGNGTTTAEGGRVRVHSQWQRVRAEILAAPGVGRSWLVLTRKLTFQGAVFEIVYHYDRTSDREHFTLVGPLARIDWRDIRDFVFRRPMEKLALRGEVAVWFTKGSERGQVGVEKQYCDSWQTPSFFGWWTGVAGPPRRVRVWNCARQVYLSVHRCADGELEMDEVVIFTAKPRRDSAPGDRKRELWVEVSSRSAMP